MMKTCRSEPRDRVGFWGRKAGQGAPWWIKARVMIQAFQSTGGGKRGVVDEGQI